MAIDDNTIYGLYGSQIKDLPEKINAVKGKAKVLTSADYNWNSTLGSATEPYNSIGLGLLDYGIYSVAKNTQVSIQPTANFPTYDTLSYIIVGENPSGTATSRRVLFNRDDKLYVGGCDFITSKGASYYYLLDQYSLTNSLTSTSTTTALTANQGKVLKDLVDSLATRGAGAPTTSTVGQVGTLYEDTTNGDLYICTDATNPYVWEEVGAGGGPTVVQTTGTSTTDVMSQNAVTSMVFADPGTKKRICIGGNAAVSLGDGSVAIGEGSFAYSQESITIGKAAKTYNGDAVAIGYNSYANADRSIALGTNSRTSAIGEMNIGSTIANAYNNSQYRLLTGLYDPQSAHDAATKGYVDNSLLGKQDALTAGDGITIADESGSLVISATGGGGGLDPNTTFWGQTASNGVVTGRITFGTNGYVNGTNNTVTVYADTAGGADPFEFSHTGLDVASKKITNLAAPTANGDAATKGYVDTAVAGAGAATFTTNEWNALWA